MCCVPGVPTVHADLHLGDCPCPTPGTAANDVRARRDGGGIVAWKGHERSDTNRRNEFFVRIVSTRAVVIKLPVVPAVGRCCRDLNALHPFDRPVPRPSRDQEANWRTVQMFE